MSPASDSNLGDSTPLSSRMDPQNQQPGKAGSGSATVGEAEDRRGLVALATRRPVAVTMLVLTVLVFGLISFARLPRSLMPNISYPSITVRTEYPGASPLDVETRVSRRLEEVLSQVRGLRLITSVSRVEMSDIILEFSWGSNMSLTTINVREKIEQVVLPKEALKPTILRSKACRYFRATACTSESLALTQPPAQAVAPLQMQLQSSARAVSPETARMMSHRATA